MSEDFLKISHISRRRMVHQATWPQLPRQARWRRQVFFFHSPKTKLQEAVETDVMEHMFSGRRETFENGVRDPLKAIADGLANSSRSLTRKERVQTHQSSSVRFSLLWMVIHQGHKSDAEYLLSEHNQKLHTRNDWLQRTVLHQAVSDKDSDLIRDIFERSSSTSPHTYIDVGDFASRTALHILVVDSVFGNPKPETLQKTFVIFDSLSLHGANLNALDADFRTPLHLLLSLTLLWKDWDPEYPSRTLLDPFFLLDRFLQAGAEVNTKDIEGKSPLHIACELGDLEAIKKLIRKGADLESLNHDWKTPRLVFSDYHGRDEGFWKDMARLSREQLKTASDPSASSQRPSWRHNRISNVAKTVCKKSAIYCRYQWNDLATESRDPLHWTATDKYVSHVFDPKYRSEDTTFLGECDKECQRAWNDSLEPFRGKRDEDDHEHKPPAGKAAAVDSSVTWANYTWRWVNFPANNVRYCHMDILSEGTRLTSFFLQITWIRDNSKTSTSAWHFFDDKMKVHDMRNNGFPIRVPHASVSHDSMSGTWNIEASSFRMIWFRALLRRQQMTQLAPNPSKNDRIENNQIVSVVSLAIPFLDIEVESPYRSIATQIEEAYSPFTGFDGVQMSQTLDQTAINAESRSKLRKRENQVIYRWSQSKSSEQEKQLPLDLTVRNPNSKLASFLRNMREKIENYDKKESKGSSSGRVGRGGRGERAGISPEIQSIRKDRRPKWLMVRQLWLWKLNDGTILSSIPLRTNVCMANDLLQTIQQSRLDKISGVDDLVKHILEETINFPDKYLRAGLGEHKLDVFKSEIASEADKEATFFNNFAQNDWDSKHANSAIDCTWRVKDILDELRLIKNVFLSQLEVVNQFSTVLNLQQADRPEDIAYITTLTSKVQNMIDHITRMEKDAEKTIESAMLSQASLKEAEEARLMNILLLPFTLVTVIFTPLSFMTSLFAVNSDGFPHNEDGEIRIPSDWFWQKMDCDYDTTCDLGTDPVFFGKGFWKQVLRIISRVGSSLTSLARLIIVSVVEGPFMVDIEGYASEVSSDQIERITWFITTGNHIIYLYLNWSFRIRKMPCLSCQ
ncbi:uncharacterized protein FMAN_05094 [Fusarium mangiferae]|uniref:Uncharacterized protein n=1 Tax=Fusarium mangiferae TaxID=192010 RepID=A0A1L7UC18_FUSMA|nr:uncharacterized protein FMAN_05094 [Fusarium mangiferae]CVL08288.1 uncharacterized protein FMAN_05094 [Fusarium mangiferae]